MVVKIIVALLTLVLGGGFGFFMLGLLSETFGLDLFDCFDKKAWKDEPIANSFRLLVIIIAILFLLAAVAAIFMYGESPLGSGEHYYSEQWEPSI